jgi:predicted enzyme related to lactoylglutathione lyase
MNKAKNLIIPGALALAVLGGVSAGALLNSLGASADTASTSSTTSNNPPGGHNGPGPGQGPHTANGKTETVLTGDDLTKAIAAAEKAVSGGTVIRAETDAEGAAFEVHMKKSDGSPVTVKLDSSFNVTSQESGMK